MPPEGFETVTIKEETYNDLINLMVEYELDSVASALEVSVNATKAVSEKLP